jgi:hypothetical protein
MKKSLIFGLIAVVSAGLLLAGCSQATDTTTTVGLNSLWGSISAAKLQEAVDQAAAFGETLEFESGLAIGTGAVNLKNTRITVYGAVTNAATLNAAYATVTRADDYAGITNSGVYIYAQGAEHDWIKGGGAKVEFLPGGIKTMQSTATAVAVREYTLGPLAGVDYTPDVPVNPTDYTTGTLSDIYVLDKLTIPGNAAISTTIAIHALGTADITGDISLATITKDKLVFAQPSVLTSSKEGGVEITLPATAPGGSGVLDASTLNVKAESGKNITFKGGDTALTVAKLEGPGNLVVNADPTAVTVNAGNGTVQFIQPVTSGTFVFQDTVAAIFDKAITEGTFTPATNTSTGKVTFEKDVIFNGASALLGDVEFKGDVTQSETLTLGGNITIANGKALTLTNNKTVTLGAGKSVFVGTAKVLTAVGVTVLTPGGASTLTAGEAAPAANPSEAALVAAKTLTLAEANLTITSGVLEAAEEGIFAITGSGITVATTAPTAGVAGGFLRLAPGGTVSLATNDAKLDFGATASKITVTGAVASLQAAGAAVTLGNDTIQGGGTGASLEVITADADIAFTGGGTTLVLDAVTLDLAAFGKLTLTGDASANTVSLKNQAKVQLNADAGVDNAGRFIKAGNVTAAISGGTPIVRGASEAATGAQVYSVAHDTGNPVLITGPASSSVALSKTGATFETAASVP